MLYPREKLETFGVEGLKTYELIALLLGSGTKSCPILPLAKKVEQHLESSETRYFEKVSTIPGIGPVKEKILIAALELGRRIFEKSENILTTIRSQEDVVRETRELLSQKKEHFVCFYLNGSNQLLAKVTVSVGTVSESLVHPREVFSEAISLSATSVICVHNHPSGNPEPSQADRQVTRRLVEAGNLLGIDVLDHIVVARGGWQSVPVDYPTSALIRMQ